MNTATRVLLAASVCVALAACSKQVKEEPAPVDTTPVTTTPVSDGRYTPADLDTDACLRQRTVYFDFDQDTLRPEFQAIMACHAKYLTDRPESRGPRRAPRQRRLRRPAGCGWFGRPDHRGVLR
jgi:peptidoglycan-associated lipoprotein